MASANGQKEIVQILLGHDGIIINQKDKNGRTALTEATRFGHTEIVDLLREQNNSWNNFYWYWKLKPHYNFTKMRKKTGLKKICG